MPVRDLFHALVRKLLERDGWKITDDPLIFPFGDRAAFIDLGAFAGEIGKRRIAVEVKGPSIIQLSELEKAIGQYVLYRSQIARHDPGRELYLALPAAQAQELFEILEFRDLQVAVGLKLLVFDAPKEAIVQWIQ